MEVTPALVLAMWCAGMALGAGVVGMWRIVGPGFQWLAAGVVALFGAATAAAGGGALAWIGTGAAIVGGVLARRPEAGAAAFAASGIAFLLVGAADAPMWSVAVGAVFLGGVTTEMMLGHWYLVDPRLPRWSLKALAVIGGAALLGEVVAVAVSGGLSFSGADAAMSWAYVALAGMTALLIVGVWFALDEPRYSGVMAATGLSYLATLTAFGEAVVGRLLA